MKNSDIDLRIDKGELRGMFALGGFYTEVSEALQMKVDVLTHIIGYCELEN